MPRVCKFAFLFVVSAALLPTLLTAQDDPNDRPLGDVARGLRKKSPPSATVIDDDNLDNVMEQAASRRAGGSALRFLMAGDNKSFRVSEPDVTCSLSFSANTKSLLASQYAQMELPPGDMLKLKGPATVEGDALIVSVFNGTDWHVSEIAVALTVVRKNPPANDGLNAGNTVPPPLDLLQEVRPEKKPDITVIYRMRAAAPPSANTVFSTPLNVDLAPGDEWHWALVQAKGYPPQGYVASVPRSESASLQSSAPVVLPSLTEFESATPAPISYANPQ
jgi:hypothetical protein